MNALLDFVSCHWPLVFLNFLVQTFIHKVTFSVVTAIEFPPLWLLATTDPTQSPRFTVFLAVFLGTVSRKAVLRFSDRNETCISIHMLPHRLQV